MSLVAHPMLFIPPQPPFGLPPDRSVVMGRSRSCDLQLPTGDASRRHAEIVPDERGFLLRDLASTNGTFVNGERVDEVHLKPGDRIQIGSNTITFCQVEVGVRPVDGATERREAETIMMERPALGDVFQGDLAEIPPFAVLQILEMGRKTGILLVDSDRGTGCLWLARGEPVHAETKEHRGFDAALAIVYATSGRFSFEPRDELPEPTIAASVTELLLEASRLMDEAPQ